MSYRSNCFSLKYTFVLEEAELQQETLGNEEGGEILSNCVEYSNEKITYSNWIMGVGQAVFNTTCLQRRSLILIRD